MNADAVVCDISRLKMSHLAAFVICIRSSLKSSYREMFFGEYAPNYSFEC